MNVKTPKTALIIGCEDSLFGVLHDVLRSNDWESQCVSNNAAAYTAARTTPYGVVITSQRTSGSEDVRLLRQIRSLRPHTRIIILTSHTTPTEVITFFREHAFAVLACPISSEELSETVSAALDAPCWDDGIEILSSKPERLQFAARCDSQTADRLVQFIREVVELPDPEREDLGNAFRELLLNAMEHGAHFDPAQTVEVGYLRTRRMVTCQIRDHGAGFSLEDVAHAAISNPPDDPYHHLEEREKRGMRAGGFGLLLARKLVDDVIYNDSGNEVTLVKYLS